MKWKPFTSGTPYTCKDCPSYEELKADRDRWRNWAEEFFYTDPDCECPLCDQVREAIGKTI